MFLLYSIQRDRWFDPNYRNKYGEKFQYERNHQLYVIETQLTFIFELNLNYPLLFILFILSNDSSKLQKKKLINLLTKISIGTFSLVAVSVPR